MPKNPHADFTPALEGYSGQGKFRFWCQMALPLTYDDSLSYYELLCKVVNYLNHTIEDVANAETNVSRLAEAYTQLQNYVNNYFDDLDIEAELRNVLDAMAEDGTLDDLLDPLVQDHLPSVVDDQIDDVVADQIGDAVAGQIDDVVAEQLPPLVDEGIPGKVSDWLTENVDPVGSAVVVDSSLTISGAAADAKVTGDELANLKTQISLFEIPLTVGYYLDTNGNAVANATNVFSVSDFYNFTAKDRFEIFDFANLSYASYALGYAFYNKDKRFISGAGDFNGDLSSDSVTIPANTEYVRFCTRTEYATNARVYINEQGGAVYKLDALRNAPAILELLRFDLVPGKYIDTSGQEVVNATNQFSATDFCAFTENDKFELFGFYSSLYASYALAYAFYDDDKTFISGTGNLDGDLSSQSITIPQNTAYARFCTRTEFVPNAKVYVNNSVGYIEKIDPLKQDVSDSLKKSEMETEIGLNKFDYTKVTTGKEIYADGTLNTQLNSAVSDFIPVYGKTKIYLKNLPTYPVADVERYCYFYNSAKEPIGTVLYIGKTVSTTDISVPSGAYYFRFSVYQRVPSETLPIDYTSVMVTTEFTNVEFEPYGEFVSSLDGYGIPKNTNKGLNVSGLKVLIFGDSITETASMNDDGTGYVEGTRNNWPKYANDIMGWSSFKNYAKSGAAYKVRAGVEYRQTVANQIALAMADSNNDDADIVIFSLGTNDGTADLGSYETAMSKTTLASLDQTKLYEALRYAYWTVKTKYKNAMCFAAIPIQRADIEPPTALYQAITEMAHRYNFIVIDAAYQSGIIKENNTWEASGNDLYDGLHPNTVGQTKIANLYSCVMMEHLLYKSN